MALSGFRLAPGTLTVAQMDAGVATYAIENFPRQNDQPIGLDWMRPGNDSDVLDPFAEFVDSLSAKRGGFGRVIIIWMLRALTPLMVVHLRTTFFNSTDLYGDVTARTWNRQTGAWEYYNARAVWPSVRSDATPAIGGYDPFRLEMSRGVAAAAA